MSKREPKEKTQKIEISEYDYLEFDNKYEEQRCHIRRRPGMYVGRVGDGSNSDDGIYAMFKEIVDNAVDEYLMGFGDRIDISVEHGMVSVRDYGRGISLDKLVKSVTKICSIEKTDTADYTFRNTGLDGVGTKVVNALSSKFEITSWREGKCRTALFHEGVLADDKYIDPGEEKSGTLVRFMPDSKIMPNYKYRLPVLEKRLQIYACLNRGLTLCLNGKKFHSPHGLLELIKNKSDDEKDNYPDRWNRKPVTIYLKTITCARVLARVHEGEEMKEHVRTYKGRLVRVMDDNGVLWFLAKDVARILGYRDANSMIRRLD